MQPKKSLFGEDFALEASSVRNTSKMMLARPSPSTASAIDRRSPTSCGERMIWTPKTCGFNRTALPITQPRTQPMICTTDFRVWLSHAEARSTGHQDHVICRCYNFINGVFLNRKSMCINSKPPMSLKLTLFNASTRFSPICARESSKIGPLEYMPPTKARTF